MKRSIRNTLIDQNQNDKELGLDGKSKKRDEKHD